MIGTPELVTSGARHDDGGASADAGTGSNSGNSVGEVGNNSQESIPDNSGGADGSGSVPGAPRPVRE